MFKKKIIDICHAVVPDAGDELHFHVDVSHRIGKKQDGKTHLVLTRFMS